MNQKKMGVMLSYISEIIKILSYLLYTPIMLRLLGQSEYGLYTLVNSVVSYLSLLSLGFTASYIRYYSRFIASKQEEEIPRLNGMFMSIFFVMSIIAIVCGFAMIKNIRVIFKDGLTGAEYSTAKVLMALMVFNLALTFPNSVLNCITSAHEKFIFQKLLTVLQNILNPFLTLPLLLLGYGSVGMVIVTTTVTLAKCLVNLWYVLFILNEKFVFRNFNFLLMKDIWGFTFFIFLNQIIDQINWSIDRFLLGRMIGTTAVAIYGLGGQINSMYVQLSSSISNVFVPKVNRIVAQKNDNRELSELFIRIGRIQFLILSLVLTGFFFLGDPFMRFWGGKGYENSYYVALLLITPVTVPLIQNLGIEIQRAKNMHKTRSLVYFFIAIVNIFISIPLIRIWGPMGAALGTALALFVGNILFMNWYYEKKIGLDIIGFWKSISTLLPAFIIPIGVGIFIKSFVSIDNLGILMLLAILYSVVFFISMWFFGMNTFEKELFRSVYRKFKKIA